MDPNAPATAQIIYELISSENLPLPPACRDGLFVGISTDTGSFRYPATTARTYEVGADLLRMGADCGALSSAVYEKSPYRRIELLKKLLGNLKMTSNDKKILKILAQLAHHPLRGQSSETWAILRNRR